jgi:hypothetical protein
MTKNPIALAALALFLLGAQASLFAQTVPVSGALDKTDWGLKKQGLVALLPAAAQDSAEVTADGVSWAARNWKQGLLSDGGRLSFNKAGALYRVSIVRMYNLEEGNTAQVFRDFVAAVTAGYVKKLGKPARDDAKTMAGPSDELDYGTVAWPADAKRAVAPALDIVITFFASGNFVYYTETCANTAITTP